MSTWECAIVSSFSVSDVLSFFPGSQLDGAVWIDQLAFAVFGALLEVADVDGTICVELTAVSTDLVLFVLGFQDLVVGEDHTVDAVADVGALSELAEPLGALLVYYLLELEIVAVEVQGLLDIV